MIRDTFVILDFALEEKQQNIFSLGRLSIFKVTFDSLMPLYSFNDSCSFQTELYIPSFHSDYCELLMWKYEKRRQNTYVPLDSDGGDFLSRMIRNLFVKVIDCGT